MSTYQQQTNGGGVSRQDNTSLPMSAMAITSLVLGILALCTSFLPIINNISFFFGLLGAIFGIIGVVGTVRGKRRGNILAIVALVINIVAVVVVLATQSMFSAAIDEASSEMSSSTTSSATTSTTEETTEATSAYAVSIDDCTTTTDYEGKPVVIVSYTFTNNADEAKSFVTAISDKCFQNGVQLDIAIVNDIDSQSSLSEVKPGASTTVQKAYVLDDQSDVTVECTEMISLSDEILAERTFSVA